MEALLGPDTVNTMPPATLTAFLEHGRVEGSLDRGVEDAKETMGGLSATGISMERVTSKLREDGVTAFADSFQKLMANIEEKARRLTSVQDAQPGVSLGALQSRVEKTQESLQERDIVGRIWRKDHTVWKEDPSEIADRLGWLAVSDTMSDQVPALQAFARDVTDAGFRDVVLLGMGGSSLGPEVLRQGFGSASGFPELTVLDSTVPARVEEVTAAIDPARTLFLVSSKSGGTIEPLSFYKHFRSLVQQAKGPESAGESFVAITDAGTSLEGLAREDRFRRIFLNPTDLGGRYSVLSYFGLVPAALMGIDVAMLLDRADCMREGCFSCVSVRDNPGGTLKGDEEAG